MKQAPRFQTTTGKGHGFSASGRISPYFDGVERAGGRGYRNHGPTYVPWSYPESAAEQYEAVTKRVTLWDTATEQQLQVKGKDARRFVDRLVTRNLLKVKPGRCTYTFVCNEAGTIICDPVLMVLDEETIWLSQSKTDLLYWAKGIALDGDYDVEISVPEVAPLQVQGPKSRDLLRKLSAYPIDDLRFFGCVKTTVAGIEAIISRTGWTGELGYEIYPVGIAQYPWGKDVGMQLWDAVLKAGEEYGILVTQFLWARAMESGITIFDGTDKGLNPLEFWRETVVDFDGDDFIGKEALIKIRAAGGPKRKMVGLVAESDADRIEPGEWDLPIMDGETIVGTTRRYAFSPTLNRAIALALVDRSHATIGQKLVIENSAGPTSVSVTALPFIDPEGARARA